MEEYSQKLLEMLVEHGQLQKKKAKDILAAAAGSGEPADGIIYAAGLMDKASLLKAKAELFKMPTIDLETYEIDVTVANVLPKAMSERYNAVCVARKGEHVVTAMADPTDAFAINYIKMRTGFEIDAYAALFTDLGNARDKIYSEGPPASATPAGFRDRVGQEVVRARTMCTANRPRIQNLSSNMIDTLQEKQRPARLINLGGEAPSRERTATALAPQRLVAPGSADELPRRSVAQQAAVDVAGRTVSTDSDELRRRYETMSRLAHVSLDLTTAPDDDTLVDRILDVASSIFDVEAVSLLLADWTNAQLFFRKARGPVGEDIINITVPLNENSVAGWVAMHHEAANIRDAHQDERHFSGVDDKLQFSTRNLLAVPVMHGKNVLGVLELINKRNGDFDEADTEFLTILAAHTAVALENTSRLQQLHNFYQQTIEILIDCYQAFDPVSRDHVVSVARMATAMGQKMSLASADMETLAYASLLHDIGKIKCGRASDALHTVRGAQLLAPVTLFSRIIPIVRSHHERWDGSGYPDGLRGEDIPLLARILAVAEGYYEESGLDPSHGHDEGALNAFLSHFGTAYDPALQEPFQQALHEQ